MSLYNRLITPVTEGANQFANAKIVNESAWLDNSIVGLAQDIYKVLEASDIADIIGEHQVLTEGASAEVVLEGIIQGGWAKLKAAFQKFWSKIKAFFAEVKKQLQLIFLRGEKFIKEFEKEINTKKAKGYKYMSYKYDEKGFQECANVLETAKGAVLEIIGKIDKTATSIENMKANNNDATLSEMINQCIGVPEDEDPEETFIKSMSIRGATTASELREELTKMCRGGDEDKTEHEDFEDLSRSEMIKYVKDMNKSLDSIKKSETKFDSALSSIISKIDKLAVKKDASEAYYKIATNISSIMTAYLNVGKIGTQVEAAMFKERAISCEAILKGFVKFKPAKESLVAGEGEVVTESSLFAAIYESVM